MGMFSFLKEAGQKLFGSKHEEEQAADPAAANQSASQAILDYISSMGLDASNVVQLQPSRYRVMQQHKKTKRKFCCARAMSAVFHV